METRKKIKVPTENQRVQADFLRNTFNEEERTIEVVFATGAPVDRFDFMRGLFIEKLSMRPRHVRLDRLKRGAPVLNNHENMSLNDMIGVVQSARIEDEKGIATVKFSSRDEVQGIVQDIRDGVIKNISVGYRVHKYRQEESASDDAPAVLLAVDWEPLEISFVTIPADAEAQARNNNNQDYDEVVVEEQEMTMGHKKTRSEEELPEKTSAAEAEEKQPQEPTAPEAEQGKTTEEEKPTLPESPELDEEGKPVESEEETERSVDPEQTRKLERERVTAIYELGRKHQLGEDFAQRCVNEDLDLASVRDLVLEELEKRNKKAKTFNHTLEVNDVDRRQLRNKARERAVLHRYDGKKYQLQDGDRQFAGQSIITMAREYLHTEMNVRDVFAMSDERVARSALHHSSDFPELLANIANKTLRDAYESTPNTYEQFTREVSRPNFKEGSSIQIGDGGKLESVNEHGEYKRSGITESAEKYKLEKFGKIIGHTWELMINDDLDAFTRIPARLGVRAREKENEVIWQLIIDNVTMAETGAALFSAAHGNLDSAGAEISVDSIGAGREAMRLQRDLDGELIGGLAPQYLYVPAALETKAQQFVTQITPDQAGQVNPFGGRLQAIVEPRLDAASSLAWYLMADAASVDMAELARLDGRGPEIFTREGFDVDGMEVKIRYVFQGKLIDYRGFYKNVGA